MRVRFSTLVGMPVIEDMDRMEVGLIDRPLLNPDRSVLEGFFLIKPFFAREHLFVTARDIVKLSHGRLHIRSIDALGPIEESIRLQPLLTEPRPIIGQRVVTEDGRVLGRCLDAQCETTNFFVEWIFVKRLWSPEQSLPTSAIVRITPEAIVVKDLEQSVPVEETTILPTLNPLSS